MNVLVPALRTCANIVSGSDHQTQQIIDRGLLNKILKLLRHPNHSVKKESLSMTFHIDNKKSTRIKLNVSMSPKDVYNNILYDGINNQNKNNKQFKLIIKHNIQSDFKRIIIPYENTNMSFWEILIQYGILDLLHINICSNVNIDDCNSNEYDNEFSNKRKMRKKKNNEKGSGIWNMLSK